MVKQILLLIIAFLLGLLYRPDVYADPRSVSPEPETLSVQNIHIATGIWPGFTEPNEQGAYFALIKLLFPSEVTFHVTYTSFNRSLKMVEDQQADMVLAIGLNDSSTVLRSARPFDVDQIAVLYKTGRVQFETPADLANYQLVTQRGYNYDLALGISTQTYEVDSILTGINLVKTDRVDVFLVEKTELEAKFMLNQLDDMQLDFIAGEFIYVGFVNNERGAALKAWWDIHFEQHLQTGVLKAWYQQHASMTLPESF